MRGRSFLWSVFLLPATFAAQSQLTKDTLKAELARDSAYIFRATFAKPFLKVENRNSFISRERVTLLGVMIGVTFRDRHTLAIGYYALDPRKEKSIPLLYENAPANHNVNLYYFPLDYQYVLLTTRYVQLNIPLSVGYGRYNIGITDSDNELIATAQGYVWPVNAGTQLILKPIQWLGISGAGGYRYIGDTPNNSLTLRGWYYSYGIWVDARQVFRNVKYHYRKKRYHRRLNSIY